MITVSTMVGRRFVDVSNELWLFIGVDLRAGKFLGVDDLSGKRSCDCCKKTKRIHLTFFLPN